MHGYPQFSLWVLIALFENGFCHIGVQYNTKIWTSNRKLVNPTYFFVSYIKVSTQNHRFPFVEFLEVIPKVFVPTLSIAKPTSTKKLNIKMIKTHYLRLRKQTTASTKQTLKIWDTSVNIPPSTCNWLYRLPGKTATWIWNICKWKVHMYGQHTCKKKPTDLTVKLLVTDKYSAEGTVSFLR